MRGQRRDHGGLWRAAAALPAMISSAALLLILAGGMSRWEGPVLLGWLGCGALTLTPVGERVAVRVGFGFHRPTHPQAAVLAPLVTLALRRCGVSPGGVDLYVQHRPAANAYTVGRRSVAVTTGLLTDFQARRLGAEQMIAVLAHELGHHAAGATRFALATGWLGAPWRCATQLQIGLSSLTLGRRQPPRLLLAVVGAGVVLAVVQAAQRQQWTAAVELAGVASAALGCPLLDAAASRRGEFTADRYAEAAGLGPQLGAALRALGSQQASDGWTARALVPPPRPRSTPRPAAGGQRAAAAGVNRPGQLGPAGRHSVRR